MSEFSDSAKFILSITRDKLLLRQKQEGMVNPEIIREELEKISSLFPEQKADTDVDACYSELLRQFSVTSTPSAVLKDTQEHVAWLTEERKTGVTGPGILHGLKRRQGWLLMTLKR